VAADRAGRAPARDVEAATLRKTDASAASDQADGAPGREPKCSSAPGAKRSSRAASTVRNPGAPRRDDANRSGNSPRGVTLTGQLMGFVANADATAPGRAWGPTATGKDGSSARGSSRPDVARTPATGAAAAGVDGGASSSEAAVTGGEGATSFTGALDDP
jgi:hypothetical protein